MSGWIPSDPPFLDWVLRATARGLGGDFARDFEPIHFPGHMGSETGDFLAWHRLAPLVLKGLNLEPKKAPNLKGDSVLRGLVEDGVRRNLRLSQELLVIVGSLQQAQIGFLVLKGLPLAMQAYGQLGLRLGRDIDLLISEKDYDCVAKALTQLGFQLSGSLVHYPPPLRWRYLSGEVWQKGDVLVDLHCRFDDQGTPFHLTVAQVIAQPSWVKIGDRQIPVLQPHDQFLYLVHHAAKHLWMRFFWIADFIALALGEQDHDWEEIIRRAKLMNMEKRLWMSMLLANDLFNFPIPKALLSLQTIYGDLEKWRREWHHLTLEKRAYTQGKVLHNPNARVFRWSLGMADRRRFRVGLAIQWLFKPASADIASLKLPARFRFLYWGWRPLRLLFRARRA